MWNNQLWKDPFEIEPFPFAMKGSLLKRHLAKVRRAQEGLADNDPSFSVEDKFYAVQASDAISR